MFRLRVHKSCGKEVEFDSISLTAYCVSCHQHVGLPDINEDVSFTLFLETQIPSKFQNEM